MSVMTEGEDPQRPYTVGTFQTKLNKFEDLIKDITYQDAEATPEERRQWITENLRFDQFCDKIRELFGSDVKNQDLKSIYRKISTNPDAKVDWSELFGYFQSIGDEEEVTVGEEVSVFMVSKRRRVGEAAGDRKRRDSVQSLKYIPALDTYLSCSQKGAITVWNGKLRLQACVEIHEPAWVTGCDYLPGMRRVACCTERSIAIWDNRAKGKTQSIFIIKPIEHSPQCMTSIPNMHGGPEDHILFGDDQGYVNILTLLAKDLNMKNSKGDKRMTNSQAYIIDPGKLTNPIVRRKLHDDWVLKVKYFPDLRCFASCSPSSTMSFVLEEVERIGQPNEEIRGVGIPKGVNCFDFCARANIIATGGVDKVIRVWHPHIFSRPTGKLLGHLFTIIDIAINERDQHIISLSTARVFRVWDIHTLTCLQVFTDNEERPGEKRIYAMIFDNKHERLLTGSSVIDTWPLTRAVQDTMQVPHSHDRSIVEILFNKELNQVVSVCTESVIKVWEMETGKIVYSIPEAHGPNIEVTTIALDKTGYRLVSGAFDGSLKVWDFGAGQVLKSKSGPSSPGEDDHSVTGIMYNKSGEDYYIIAAGWNNTMRMYLDAADNNDLVLLREFSDCFILMRDKSSISSAGSRHTQVSHRSQHQQQQQQAIPTTPRNPFTPTDPLPDIGQPRAQVTSLSEKENQILVDHEVSCLTPVNDDLLATGCTNGNIIFWSVKKASVDKVYILPKDIVKTASSKSPTERRVNQMKVLVHKVHKPDPAYIKKLMATHHSATQSDSNHSLLSRKSRTSLSTSDKQTVAQSEDKVSEFFDEMTSKVEGTETNAGRKGESEMGTDETSKDKPPDGSGKEPTIIDADDDKFDEDFDYEKIGMLDPNAKMIVESYDPILVSVHQDSFIRFWNMSGVILRDMASISRRQGTPVTSVCHDEDVNIMITGDSKGYLTLWDVKEFLEDPETEDPNCIKQVICWRAHMSKIVSLVYVEAQKAVLSASVDGSIRVWWGKKGRFVGFFSQHRPFNFPISEDSNMTTVLPYDINEGPLAPMKKKSASHKIRSVQKFEYPLVFDKERWEPFRRSAYLARREQVLRPEDKKFFGALIKPKAYNSHLESFTTAEKNTGAVFRALPVYRVSTPENPKTPKTSFKMSDDDDEMYSGNRHGGLKSLRRARDANNPLKHISSVVLALQGSTQFKKSLDKHKNLGSLKQHGRRNKGHSNSNHNNLNNNRSPKISITTVKGANHPLRLSTGMSPLPGTNQPSSRLSSITPFSPRKY